MPEGSVKRQTIFCLNVLHQESRQKYRYDNKTLDTPVVDVSQSILVSFSVLNLKWLKIKGDSFVYIFSKIFKHQGDKVYKMVSQTLASI